MKSRVAVRSVVILIILGFASELSAQVTASQDTIYVTGGTFSGCEYAGTLESTINGDTTSTGARVRTGSTPCTRGRFITNWHLSTCSIRPER